MTYYAGDNYFKEVKDDVTQKFLFMAITKTKTFYTIGSRSVEIYFDDSRFFIEDPDLTW